jgi:hypothetical protein
VDEADCDLLCYMYIVHSSCLCPYKAIDGRRGVKDKAKLPCPKKYMMEDVPCRLDFPPKSSNLGQCSLELIKHVCETWSPMLNLPTFDYQPSTVIVICPPGARPPERQKVVSQIVSCTPCSFAGNA